MAMSGFGMVDAHLRDKRIFIVDDERELASMVATILHGAGFTCVDIAHSGTEALPRSTSAQTSRNAPSSCSCSTL